jgi:hypothetical protein
VSIHWIDRVWKLSQQKGSPLLLMLAIADSANDDGLAFPGHHHLAVKTRLSSRHVITMLDHVERAGELVTETGGQGAKDTNQYVMLLGRDAAEIETIIELIKAGKGAKYALSLLNKGEKISPLSDRKGEKISPIRVKKSGNKGEVASSPDPLPMDGKDGLMDEWMKSDFLCQFLISLPGYNPANVKRDRAAIQAQSYDLEAFQFLWEDCANGDNPIGLFLYRAGKGIQSPRFVELCRQRKDEERRLAESHRFLQPAPQPAALIEPLVVDPSVTQPMAGTHTTPLEIWQAAQGELQLQMSKSTYDTWVKPANLISLNGTWKIAVPTQASKTWWDTRMMTTLKRVLSGIAGQPCEPEFVFNRGAA